MTGHRPSFWSVDPRFPAGMTSGPQAGAGPAVVAPLARALALISAFGPRERWLGNGQLAHRTGLPPSTITRIAQTLVRLGYLVYDEAHKYRLAPSVLGLGHAAIAHPALQGLAVEHMERFALRYKAHVCLAVRDRLDLVVFECRRSPEASVALPLHVGMRVGMARSPMGWALLGALPELERAYLLEYIERRADRDWARLRRRVYEGIVQVCDKGYCTAIGEWEADLGVMAAPVLLADTSPFVLACIGASQGMTRARVERDLGPGLLAAGAALQAEFNTIDP